PRPKCSNGVGRRWGLTAKAPNRQDLPNTAKREPACRVGVTTSQPMQIQSNGPPRLSRLARRVPPWCLGVLAVSPLPRGRAVQLVEVLTYYLAFSLRMRITAPTKLCICRKRSIGVNLINARI